MARVAVRTATLNRDIGVRAMGLFGTVKNTSRQLGLERLVPYINVYNAFQFMPIRPEHKEQIEDAWNRWQQLFLRPEVPVYDELAVTDENREVNPPWFASRRKGKRDQ